MHNYYSSGIDNESNNVELVIRKQIQQSQLPRLMRTPSDLKHPKINLQFIDCLSPFTEPLRSFISYRKSELNHFYQSGKAKTLNINSEEIDSQNFDESGIKKFKKSQFNYVMRSSHNLFDKKFVK